MLEFTKIHIKIMFGKGARQQKNFNKKPNKSLHCHMAHVNEMSSDGSTSLTIKNVVLELKT